MQHIVHALHRRLGDLAAPNVAGEEFEPFRARLSDRRVDVLALTREEVVQPTDHVPVREESLNEIGADEAGRAGHEVCGHWVSLI